MAGDDTASLVADEKRCKYCKSNVEKSFVKCLVCKVYFHSSCALRITGQRVASGSKNQIICGAVCANTVMEHDLQLASKVIDGKNEEIAELKVAINKLQTTNE